MQLLPPSELEVMLALWQAEEPVPRAWLDAQLTHKKWNINTMNTYLTRLQEKGFVHCTRTGRQKLYTPAVPQEEYMAYEGSSVLQRLYGSSVKNFVAALAGTEALDEAGIGELRAYLDSLERGEENA